ncbi:CMD domain protein [Sinorhizobium medicae]|uniref:CMD domain protein n=1 Tax=Sinorhizobium medicae TaxID=110321 RepID=UPI000C7AFCED|nr:CMD domain protein [Sinorhizobium medicae]PLU51444.1 CMD domain protein [Sinorhizobium medicae]
MTVSTKVDVIDAVLGLDSSSPVHALRERRAKLKHFTQTSYEAAFTPSDPGNFSFAMRAALAARMAGHWRSAELQAHYKELLEERGSTPGLQAIADPGLVPEGDERLATILAHVDLVTLKPREAARANIEALYAVGLDDRDIVTLAGLIAFVNYQVLVVAGVKMLRDN